MRNSGPTDIRPAPGLELVPDWRQRPIYRARWKDIDGFPTVVVAGPDRERIWLYGHGPSVPTMLRLHRPVVRFLLDALTELTDWLGRPHTARGSLMWTLPRRDSEHPECILIASDARTWLHVYAMTPSVLRMNPPIVAFLRQAMADLPAAEVTEAGRSVSEADDPIPPAGLIRMAAQP